jgi:LysR family glycine cleavage system transcriptional activator
MTQSAVSQQIKSLESALGRTLFLRRVRGLELTDEGRGYLPTVQAAFTMLEEGTKVLTDRNDPDALELHANLSFALFWLSPRLGRFLDQHPWVQLNLATAVWAEERPNASASIHIVFGQNKREGLAGKRLTRDTVFPVCSPELGERVKTIEQLLSQRLFDLPGTVQSWDSWLDAHAGTTRVPRPAIHRASTWALSMDWAQRGLGVCLAHDTIANDLLRQGRLVRPFEFALPMQESYYLVAPEGSQTNPAAKAFKDWLVAEMAQFQTQELL